MRPRKHDRHLPPCVYLRRGVYYHVKAGKWTRLGTDLPAALAEYARRHAHGAGTMPALIEQALPDLIDGKADETARQYRQCARRLQDVLAEFQPHQVTARHALKIHRTIERDSPAVANRTLTVLSLVFDWALEEEVVDSNPCVGLKRAVVPSRRRRITADELVRIRAAATPKLRAIIDLCVLTGQRIGDVLTMRREHLRDDGIYVEQQKTGARLTVRWTPELRAAVEAAKGTHGAVPSLYVLKGNRGRPPSYRPVWRAWRAACKAAGVADANLHDLRAMSATEADAQGRDATRLLGHSDRRVTRRYLRDKLVPLVDGPTRVLDKTG